MELKEMIDALIKYGFPKDAVESQSKKDPKDLEKTYLKIFNKKIPELDEHSTEFQAIYSTIFKKNLPGKSMDITSIWVRSCISELSKKIVLFDGTFIEPAVNSKILIKGAYYKFNQYDNNEVIHIGVDGNIFDNQNKPLIQKDLKKDIISFINQEDKGDGVSRSIISLKFGFNDEDMKNLLEKMGQDVLVYKVKPGSYSCYK